MLRTLVTLFATVVAFAAAQAVLAQEPSPVPTPTMRPDEGFLIVRVVHDLNADGIADPGEPGLENWLVEVNGTCGGDVIVEGLQGLTDADGRARFVVRDNNCIEVLHDTFGWRLTAAPRFSHVFVDPGATVEAVWLYRKVGQQLHRFEGNVYVDGLPAPEGTIVDALVDGQSCSDVQFVFWQSKTTYSLYVLGDADRPGCAVEGETVDITVNGAVVHRFTFTSFPQASSTTMNLTLGASSMWFLYGEFPRDRLPVPYVGNIVCGEARRDFGAWGPPAGFLFVLAAGTRPGCGEPGAVVTIRQEGENPRYVLWQEGFVFGVQPQFVELPDTGSGVGADGANSPVIAGLLAAGFGLLVLGGMGTRRPVQPR